MKLFIKIIILFIILNYSELAFAKDSTAKSGYNLPEIVYDDIKCAGADAGVLSYKISKLDNKDLLYATAIGGGVALSFLLDNEVRTMSKNNINSTNERIFSITNRFGDGVNAVVFSGSIYLGGLLFGSQSVRTTGRLMLETLVLSGITTMTIKYVAGRGRPFLNNGNGDFNFFSLDDRYNSFPSGHTTVAFSMASVLARQIDTWWAYTGCYSLAILTGGARIYKDMHWFSDIVLSAAVGIVSGNVICSSDGLVQWQRSRKSQTLLIYPTLNGFGLALKI